jgi:hypothetical protein
MKLWKKIFLILISIGLLAQIPFVYQIFQKRKLASKIAELNANRTTSENPDYNEFKGVIHVHSSLGGHSTGDFEELLIGAQDNELDFVVMTEHGSALYDTSAMTLRGFNEGVLFIGGNELDTENQDRYLLLPGSEKAEEMTRESNEEFLEIVHSQDKIAIMTYPEKYKEWDSKYDGIEVFNMSTNLKGLNVPYFIFDALWSFGFYPELTLAGYLKRPENNLRRFDEISTKRKIMLVGGPDAHSNIGFHFLGDDAGNKLLDLKFDGYGRAFRIVRTHVLLEKSEQLSQESILRAIKNGHSFLGFDVLSDTTGFTFTATNGQDSCVMGGEITFAAGQTILKSSSSLESRFIVFRNGEKINETSQSQTVSLPLNEKGVYRVEVYLDSLGKPFDQMPWIISNPIYVN